MELVLGLAALATAISSVGGANQINDAPSESGFAEATSIEGKNDFAYESELSEYDFVTPDIDHYDFGNIGDRLKPEKKPHPTAISEHEPNNRVKEAYDIGQYLALYSDWDMNNHPANGAPHITTRTFSGCIEENDVDWFHFSLYGKADVKIELTDIPANCNYTLTLYRLANKPKAKDEDVVQIAYSNKRSNLDELIDLRLYAGKYYIKVESIEGYGTSKYYLSVNPQYVRNDMYIEDLMDVGAKGALWLADYDPFGIQPSDKIERGENNDVSSHFLGKEYSHFISGLNSDNYTPEFDFKPDVAYKQAELFIWDHDYRLGLYDMVDQIYKKAEKLYTEAVDLYIEEQKQAATNSIALTVFGAIAGQYSKVAEWIVTAKGLSDDAMDYLFPRGNIFENISNLKEHLSDLGSALYCTGYSSKLDVIRIPVRYTIKDDHKETKWDGLFVKIDPVDVTDKYYLSYTPTGREPEREYDDGIKNPQPGDKRTIHAIDFQGQSPFAGTIYPIVDKNSLSLALKHRTAVELTLQTPQELDYLESDTLSLGNDEFKWYSFTAPLPGINNYRFESISANNNDVECDVSKKVIYGNSYYYHELLENNENMTTIGHVEGQNRDFIYDFSLEQGETVYFRVHGGRFGFDKFDGWHYAPVWGSIVRVTYPAQSSTLSFEATDMGLGYHYTDPIMNTNFMQDNDITFDYAVGVQLGSDRVMMHVDMDGDYPITRFALNFHREIRSISFNAYKDPMRNECALFLRGYDQCGDLSYDDYLYGIETDLECDKTFTYIFDQTEVYCFEFSFDPANDPISYWQRKETVYLGHFVVEFKD